MQRATQTQQSRPLIVFTALITAAFSSAAASAELVVRHDGAELANHTELFIPETEVGDTSQLVIVLRNEGIEDLVFSETPPIMLAGGFAEQFELIQPALEVGNLLSPNGSTAFAIRFSPTFELPNAFTHVYIWTSASSTPFHLIVRSASFIVPEEDLDNEPVDEPLPEDNQDEQDNEQDQPDNNAGDQPPAQDIEDEEEQDFEDGEEQQLEDDEDFEDLPILTPVAPCGFGVSGGMVMSLLALGALRLRKP
jgi:hypothetical protein